jgi:hypothetical protein
VLTQPYREIFYHKQGICTDPICSGESGLLLLSFHQGQEIIHLDEWWGKQVSLDFIFFERAEMEAYLRAAGLEIEDSLERPPYVEAVETQTRRVYIFARKSL